MSAYSLWKAENDRVTQGDEFLGGFNNTGTTDRRFCTKYGGHLMSEHSGMGYTNVRAAILPSVAFRPTVHLNYVGIAFPTKDGPTSCLDPGPQH